MSDKAEGSGGCKSHGSCEVQRSIIDTMSSSNMRFHERANAASATAIENQNNVSLQFQVKGVGNLEKDRNQGQDNATLLLQLMALNNRAGGVSGTGVATGAAA